MGDAPIVNNLDADLVKCQSSGEGFGVVVLLPKDDFPEEPHDINPNTFIIEKVDGYMGIRLDRIVKNEFTKKWELDKNEKYFGIRLKTGEKYSKDKGKFSKDL